MRNKGRTGEITWEGVGKYKDDGVKINWGEKLSGSIVARKMKLHKRKLEASSHVSGCPTSPSRPWQVAVVLYAGTFMRYLQEVTE
jgi:hypothetical protein